MIEAIRFLYIAWEAYRGAQRDGQLRYRGITRNGVPHTVIFVGVGREAWRITQRAVEEFEVKR